MGDVLSTFRRTFDAQPTSQHEQYNNLILHDDSNWFVFYFFYFNIHIHIVFLKLISLLYLKDRHITCSCLTKCIFIFTT